MEFLTVSLLNGISYGLLLFLLSTGLMQRCASRFGPLHGAVDMAIQWVAHSELPLVDVGVRMGFSDSSTFHRAFKRWTGSAPGEYRRAGGLSACACAVSS